MNDLERFCAAWAVLLVIVAAVQAVRSWRNEEPAPAPDHGVVLLQLAALASLRWWAFPLLYIAALAGTFGFGWIDDCLCDLVAARGWKVVTREPAAPVA